MSAREDAPGDEPNNAIDGTSVIPSTNEQITLLQDHSIFPAPTTAAGDCASAAAVASSFIETNVGTHLLLPPPRPTEPTPLDTVNTAHTTNRAVGRPIHSLYLPGPDGPLIDCKNTLYSHSLAEFNEAVDGSTSLFGNEHELNANAANGLVAVAAAAADSNQSTESRPWADHGCSILVDDDNCTHANRDNAPSGNVANGFYKQIMHGVRRISTSLLGGSVSAAATGAARHSRPTIVDSSPTLVLELQSLSINRQPDSLGPPEADDGGLIYHPTGRPIVSSDPNIELTASSDEGRRLLATSATADGSRLEPWWQTRWLLLRLCALVIAALVVVLVLLVSGRLQAPGRMPFGINNPSSPESSNRRAQQIMKFINKITLSGQHIALVDIHAGFGATPATAEERAMRWLIHDDQLRLASNQKFRLQQRYALATLWALQHEDAPSDDKINRHECEWAGISCDKSDIGLVVTNISLFNASWSGSLVADVGLLSSLVHFDMSNNSLTGTLPSFIDRWTKLYYFDVASNSLGGALPTTIGRWTNLTRFDVSFNRLTNSLPDSIGAWAILEHFEVSNNSFTGSLPQSVQHWTRLKHFSVFNNTWTGALPGFMLQWTNLNYCNVWGGTHNGSVLEQLPYVQDVVQFISTITARKISARKLPSLAPSANLIEASTEEMVIQWLLENSLLTNLLPDTAFRRFKLQQRYAIATMWAQPIFRHATVEKILTAGRALSERTRLPSVMGDECEWAGVSCEPVFLSNDTGAIPTVTKIMLSNTGRGDYNGDWNWYWDRGWSCRFSSDLGLLQSVVQFDVSVLRLTGSFPDTLERWTNLEYFSVGGTWVEGALPDCISSWTALRHIDIAGSNVKGSLPASIGSWTRLESFSAGGCHLTGHLPESVGAWTNLTSFSAHENRLSGSLPSTIGQWKNLYFFSIHDNLFHGQMPYTIKQWTSLRVALMSSNRLEGYIPTTLCSAMNVEKISLDCAVNCSCGWPKCKCVQ